MNVKLTYYCRIRLIIILEMGVTGGGGRGLEQERRKIATKVEERRKVSPRDWGTEKGGK